MFNTANVYILTFFLEKLQKQLITESGDVMWVMKMIIIFFQRYKKVNKTKIEFRCVGEL